MAISIRTPCSHTPLHHIQAAQKPPKAHTSVLNLLLILTTPRIRIQLKQEVQLRQTVLKPFVDL